MAISVSVYRVQSPTHIVADRAPSTISSGIFINKDSIMLDLRDLDFDTCIAKQTEAILQIWGGSQEKERIICHSQENTRKNNDGGGPARNGPAGWSDKKANHHENSNSQVAEKYSPYGYLGQSFRSPYPFEASFFSIKGFGART